MGSNDRPWQNSDVLRELYHEKRLSQPQIAEKLGCSRWTVRKWMDKHDIEVRDSLEGRYTRIQKQPDISFGTMAGGYEQVRQEYKGERYRAYIHRLLAVCEYGFDEIDGKHVHHKNHIPWDNRASNIELKNPGEHQTEHLHIRHGNDPLPSP